MVRCAVWYHLYILKNMKNTHGGTLACHVTFLIFTFFVQIVQNLAAHLICDNLFHSFLNTKTCLLFELLSWLSNPIDSIHTNLNQINFFSVHAVFSWYKVICANIMHFLDWKCLIMETISVKKEMPVCRNLFVSNGNNTRKTFLCVSLASFLLTLKKLYHFSMTFLTAQRHSCTTAWWLSLTDSFRTDGLTDIWRTDFQLQVCLNMCDLFVTTSHEMVKFCSGHVGTCDGDNL